MIVIALGANLPSPQHGAPLDTLEQALIRLDRSRLRIVMRSRWYETAPVPLSDQPWYLNGVIAVETDMSPQDLMALLHRIEEEFGRVRTAINAPRVLDLDLIIYHNLVDPAGWPCLPHPRMCRRGFVLHPLSDIAPHWCDPVSGHDLTTLIARLDRHQTTRPIEPVLPIFQGSSIVDRRAGMMK